MCTCIGVCMAGRREFAWQTGRQAEGLRDARALWGMHGRGRCGFAW